MIGKQVISPRENFRILLLAHQLLQNSDVALEFFSLGTLLFLLHNSRTQLLNPGVLRIGGSERFQEPQSVIESLRTAKISSLDQFFLFLLITLLFPSVFEMLRYF